MRIKYPSGQRMLLQHNATMDATNSTSTVFPAPNAFEVSINNHIGAILQGYRDASSTMPGRRGPEPSSHSGLSTSPEYSEISVEMINSSPALAFSQHNLDLGVGDDIASNSTSPLRLGSSPNPSFTPPPSYDPDLWQTYLEAEISQYTQIPVSPPKPTGAPRGRGRPRGKPRSASKEREKNREQQSKSRKRKRKREIDLVLSCESLERENKELTQTRDELRERVCNLKCKIYSLVNRNCKFTQCFYRTYFGRGKIGGFAIRKY